MLPALKHRPPSPPLPAPLQEGFRPAKYFSIDRVFRNEAIDRTHLAEFHQIEGARAGQGSFHLMPSLCCPDLASTLPCPAAHARPGGLPRLARSLPPLGPLLPDVWLPFMSFYVSRPPCPSSAASGVVCDYGLTLADLIGTLQQFFDRLGLKKLRFKPAFNPYTEPSMEIFRWVLNCTICTASLFGTALCSSTGKAALVHPLPPAEKHVSVACSRLPAASPAELAAAHPPPSPQLLGAAGQVDRGGQQRHVPARDAEAHGAA